MAELEAILARIAAGDVDAYAEIVRAWQEDVRRVAAYALRDFDATEDLVQQTFVNAYARLGQFRPGGDFGAWLRGIARNLVREEFRRRGREENRLAGYREAYLARLAGDGEADRREARLRDALADCRRKLAPDAARLLDLRYGEAKGFAEIARSLGRTVAATRQALSRVRLALRDCVAERTAP